MEPVKIDVRVVVPGADAESVQDLAFDLRRAILDTDVDDVRPATAHAAPAGAKSGTALTVGALVVTLAPTVMEGLMAVVASWLSRQPRDVEIEVDGTRFRGPVTRQQRDELVKAYLHRLEREP
ncbi:hypothetical protein [Actinoplanes sp. URMC 104]|uniref:hypothetical protein n=1 Tax=Actinoplanes sp. URMC 104 TaxID=3423409 RepID=UPI003F1B78AF